METYTSKQYLDIENDGEEIELMESGVVKLLGGLGEVMARKVLYFSTFEDMNFQMNGLTVSNIFGEGNEVISELMTYHKEKFKFSVLSLLGSSSLIGNPTKYVNNIGTGV